MIKLAEACPWKEHLSELEKEADLPKSIKFVLYKESNSDKWRVQVCNEKRGNIRVFVLSAIESYTSTAVFMHTVWLENSMPHELIRGVK